MRRKLMPSVHTVSTLDRIDRSNINRRNVVVCPPNFGMLNRASATQWENSAIFVGVKHGGENVRRSGLNVRQLGYQHVYTGTIGMFWQTRVSSSYERYVHWSNSQRVSFGMISSDLRVYHQSTRSAKWLT
ncbi:hypothetical protein ANTPLA_LOCUS8372 [Anthophora plagiata]